jgi:hypothetical protein
MVEANLDLKLNMEKDQELSGFLIQIAKARKYLYEKDTQQSIDTAHTALEHFLRHLCLTNGASDTTPFDDKGSMKPFNQWGFMNYITYLEKDKKLPHAMKVAFTRVNDLRKGQ